jgi:DNA modification methylase
MKTETWPLERLIDYARNPRKNDHAVDKVAAAIKEFGFRVPIVAKSDGLVVDGHLRLKAARKLGLAEVPVVLADDLTDAQVKAFRISVNRMAELAEWDSELLALELGELGELGFDLELTGFSEDEANALTPEVLPEGKTDPDEVPETPATPRSVLGDVWLCGKHRVMCGDSTKAEDVERLLDGKKPFLMVTDPPYGVNYDPKWREDAKRDAYMEADHDVEISWSAVWAHFPGDVAYIWHSDKQRKAIQEAMETLGFEFRAELVWMKTVWPMGRAHWKQRHEPCCYFVRKNKVVKWNDVAENAHDDTTVIEARPPGAAFGRTKNADADEAGLTDHACQKPLACMAKPISRHGTASDTVYEPFCGSGSTLIAAEQLGRVCYGMELTPAFVDIIVKRWQDYTGKKATREADGVAFDEVG